ncbi:MAG: hypothetical protein JWP40_3924 [Blastococcus sp.]|jgi:hypothetical protein|nr:hypothetical protein [Blastococcus sp.]
MNARRPSTIPRADVPAHTKTLPTGPQRDGCASHCARLADEHLGAWELLGLPARACGARPAATCSYYAVHTATASMSQSTI